MNREAASGSGWREHGPRDPALIEKLASGWGDLEADASRDRSLDALADGAAVVVAGQQPGIFGGPLYALHKAATAIRWAADRSRAGRPTVPVFWLASDDSDVAEADRYFAFAEDHLTVRLHHLGLGPPRSLDHIPMQAPLLAATRGLPARVPESMLPREGEAFPRWTARLLAEVFRGRGLMIIEPRALMPLAIPMTRRLIAESSRLRAHVGGSRTLRPLPSGVTPFFGLAEGAKRRWILEEEASKLDAGRFTPSVQSRVFVQQHLFGATAQICGPGEMAYLADLEAFAPHLDLPWPELVPRASFALVGERARRLAGDLGLDLELALREPGILAARTEESDSGRRFLAGAREVLAALGRPIDGSESFALRRAIHAAEAEIRHADRRRGRRANRARQALREILLPRGRPQDRVFSTAICAMMPPDQLGALLVQAVPSGERASATRLLHLPDGVTDV